MMKQWFSAAEWLSLVESAPLFSEQRPLSGTPKGFRIARNPLEQATLASLISEITTIGPSGVLKLRKLESASRSSPEVSLVPSGSATPAQPNRR